MTTIGDISPVPQRRIPWSTGRHGIFSVLWTWLFRLGSFDPGFLSSRAFRPGYYADIDDAAPEVYGPGCLVGGPGDLPVRLVDDRGSANSHRPHRALDQAAALRPLPDGITDLDHFRI